MATRAKFYCTAENTKRFGANNSSRFYDFTAVYDADTPENERFAKATPTGSLTLQVDNPAVSFEPGTYYYIDITPAA